MNEHSQAASKKTLLEWVSALFSDEPSDRSELMEMLRDAADRQIMDAEALNIIFGALQVSDMQARDIMIPRTQLVYLKANDPPEVLLPTIIESQHSRLPGDRRRPSTTSRAFSMPRIFCRWRSAGSSMASTSRTASAPRRSSPKASA
jgi:Mg2+/Co2+ transporter CorC